jgi:hypothetical protein
MFPTFVFNRLNWGISVGENTTAPSQKKKNLNKPLGLHKLYITIITLFVNENNKKSQYANHNLRSRVVFSVNELLLMKIKMIPITHSS